MKTITLFGVCNHKYWEKIYFIKKIDLTINKEELRNNVAFGYKTGIIKIIYANAIEHCGCDGIACQIGNCCFYFAGLETEEYENAKDYIANVPENELIDKITDAIIGIHEEIEFEDPDGEGAYYYNFLKDYKKHIEIGRI